MWLFTTSGFISIVNKTGAFEVRARDAKSLETLADFAKTRIIKTPFADYPYRAFTTHETFTYWVANQIEMIDYPNFKSEISLTRGPEFAIPLHKVWSAMHGVEDANARKE